jgi:hypothetical protein
LDDLLSAFDRAARWIDGYYQNPGRYPVLSRAEPGELHRALPAEAPETASRSRRFSPISSRS